MSALSREQRPNYNSNQTMPRVILLLLTVTAAWGKAAAAVEPERIDYTGNIGHIVRLQDGRLLTLYTLGRAGEDSSLNGPEQPAYVRYSGNQGYSWSKARIAFSFAAGRGTMPTYRQSAGPYLLLDRAGTVHSLAIRYYPGPKRGDPTVVAVSELFHNRSRDGGRTWSTPKRIDVVHHWFPQIQSMIELSNGRLLTAGNYASDDGKTWSPSRLIAGPSTPDPENAQIRYPFLCQTGDGSVLLRYHRIERALRITRRDLLRIDPDWISE